MKTVQGGLLEDATVFLRRVISLPGLPKNY